MGTAHSSCCSADAGSSTPAPAAWAALVEGGSQLHLQPAPGSWQRTPPRVPLYEGPGEQNRRLGWLEPGAPASVLEESSDGRWVRVRVATEHAGSHVGGGLSGWVNARSVPQDVVLRLCQRVDLGRPSFEAVHEALSRNGGDLTDAVRDLREQFASQLSWTPEVKRRASPPRAPSAEIVEAVMDAGRLSPEEAERRDGSTSCPSRLRETERHNRKAERSTAGRADLI